MAVAAPAEVFLFDVCQTMRNICTVNILRMRRVTWLLNRGVNTLFGKQISTSTIFEKSLENFYLHSNKASLFNVDFLIFPTFYAANSFVHKMFDSIFTIISFSVHNIFPSIQLNPSIKKENGMRLHFIRFIYQASIKLMMSGF